MAPAVLAPIVCAGKPPLRDSGLWRSVGFQKLITTLAVLALGYWVSESVPLTTCILVSEQPASPVAYPLSLGGSKSLVMSGLLWQRVSCRQLTVVIRWRPSILCIHVIGAHTLYLWFGANILLKQRGLYSCANGDRCCFGLQLAANARDSIVHAVPWLS